MGEPAGCVAVAVAVTEGVCVTVWVAVGVAVWVAVAVAVCVAVAVDVPVAAGDVAVQVAVALAVCVAVTVGVSVGLLVGVQVAVGVPGCGVSASTRYVMVSMGCQSVHQPAHQSSLRVTGIEAIFDAGVTLSNEAHPVVFIRVVGPILDRSGNIELDPVRYLDRP